MKIKRNLLITFDYELFLGKNSGTVQNCLIEPTNRLISIFNNKNIKLIFFVDTIYLLRLKKIKEKYEKAGRDWEQIISQLQLLLKDGHYLFPHLHPHWLDAKYLPEINQWDLSDISRYRFHSLAKKEKDFVFDESIKLLHEIIDPIKPEYKIDSYRAGGWSIQPFEDFKPYFEKYGIKNDFSVIPGKYLYSSALNYDYSAIYKNEIYQFDENITITATEDSFIEYPISTISFSFLEKWLFFKFSGIIKRLGLSSRFYGETVNMQVEKQGDELLNGAYDRMTASFEGLNPVLLLKFILKIPNTTYFHFISHPKLLDRFILVQVRILFQILSLFKIQTDFRNIS